MLNCRHLLIAALAIGCVAVTACATLQGRDPPQVMVAGIEPLEGEGLELRMTVKLRVQNPNDTPIDYNGVSVQMNVQGETFASGVSDETGSVPRFGETVIAVPVTISAFHMVRQAVGMMHDAGTGKITYEMKGKLSGSGFGGIRFTTKGDFNLPGATAASSP
jgi:LEA14-like dessication related protein